MVDALWAWAVKWVPGWKKWLGPGTDDDKRNFGWRITEAMIVEVEWAKYLFDIRLGFVRGMKWYCYLGLWKPVTQNFWNGIFTFNIYVIKTRIGGIPMILPRVGLVIRFARNRYFQTGAGILFDRGEFAWKFRIADAIKEGDTTVGWEEGSV